MKEIYKNSNDGLTEQEKTGIWSNTKAVIKYDVTSILEIDSNLSFKDILETSTDYVKDYYYNLPGLDIIIQNNIVRKIPLIQKEIENCIESIRAKIISKKFSNIDIDSYQKDLSESEALDRAIEESKSYNKIENDEYKTIDKDDTIHEDGRTRILNRNIRYGEIFEHDGSVIIKGNIGNSAIINIRNGGIEIKGGVGNDSKITVNSNVLSSCTTNNAIVSNNTVSIGNISFSGDGNIEMRNINGRTTIIQNGVVIMRDDQVINNNSNQIQNTPYVSNINGITIDGRAGNSITANSAHSSAILNAAGRVNVRFRQSSSNLAR